MLHALMAQASNIKPENERRYKLEEFLELYPQFEGLVPTAAMDGFNELVNACISERRYGKMWTHACGLFMAHLCTLYIQSAKEAGTPADEVMNACQAAGVVTSESADGVSYNMDLSAMQDLNGWAAFKLTTFGVQFATIAKLMGKGGVYVW